MNDGQTRGIPIGPDTSLILAEILLAAVDDGLIEQFDPLVRGYRYVDDYELSCVTLSEAEAQLTALQGLLGEYELLLNPRKTSLIELPASLQDNWSVDLSRFPIRDRAQPIGQRNDLIALFSKALEVARERPLESVLRYAVARVERLNVGTRAWRTFHNCVLSAVTADSSTLAVALGAIHEVSSRGGHAVAKTPLRDVFESIIHIHAPRAQGSEVAWAVWGALGWNVDLSADAAALVSKMDDNIVALLSMHAEDRRIFPVGSIDRTLWDGLVNQPDVLESENWLLGYEANQKGWLGCPAVAADPIYSAMSAANVSFYDPAEGVPQFPLAARGMPGGRLPNYYA